MVTTRNRFASATALVLLLAILLRVALAWVNREANDDHIPVIRVMAYENRVPAKDELWEAFQPKLYHATVAALWRLAPAMTPVREIRIAQMVSCVAGVLTLFVALWFLNAIQISEKVRFLSFTLVALNPGLIGINAQATNDSFVILFASLSLVFGFRFFRDTRWPDFCAMTLAAVLAGLSKGNGLVTCVAIASTFLISFSLGQRGDSPTRRDAGVFGVVFLLLFFSIVPTLGPYWEHFRLYGSPFVINTGPLHHPSLFKRTYLARPGVTSIVDALLTFRFIDLLMHPINSVSPTDYPLHRTSLWSQLYARTHFVHFGAWPPSWELRTSLVCNLGRLIFVVGLLPTALLVAAIGRRGLSALRQLRAGSLAPESFSDWLLEIAVVGHVVFVVLYALRFRDYGFMKAIFLMPGWPGFLMLFARECDRYYTWCDSRPGACRSSDAVFACLIAAYTLDVVILVDQLSLKLLA